MERYFRALDDYMQDVRRFQEGGRTKKEGASDDLVLDIASQFGIDPDPKKSKNLTAEERKELISIMSQMGVSVEQFARAINRPVEYIQKFVSG